MYWKLKRENATSPVREGCLIIGWLTLGILDLSIPQLTWYRQAGCKSGCHSEFLKDSKKSCILEVSKF